MSELGIKYWGGWGVEGTPATMPSTVGMAGGIEEVIRNIIRSTNVTEREEIYKKWRKVYEETLELLIHEEDLQEVKKKDTYLSSVGHKLGIR
jgi:phage terminase large subunit